jgi:thiol-disulfide isomerase/thioredoxin
MSTKGAWVTGNARWLVVAAAVVIAVVVLYPFFRPSSVSQSGPSSMAGQSAPVYAMYDDRGNATSLSVYRGRVVVMNLWASWCPPCRAEMPDLQRLADQYGKSGVVVIGVDQGETSQRAQLFAQSLHIQYPIWVDTDQRYGRVYAALGLPTTVVIGTDGVVVRGFDGPLTYDQMRATVAPLLKTSS